MKLKKRTLVRPVIVLSIMLLGLLVLTSCTRGLQPVGWSGFAEANGVMYTGSKEGRLVEVSSANFTRRFADPITVTSSGGFGCGTQATATAIYGTPGLAGGLIYIAGYNGEVHAYAADTLVERWVYPRKGLLKPIIGSIVVSGNTLYFGSTDGNVYGLDTETGDKKWQFGTGGEIWSTPAIANNTLYIGSFDKKIYAVDISSQSQKWEFTTGATNVAPPVVFDGLVYVGSLDRKLYALRESDGVEVWSHEAKNWFWARPIVHDGVVYAPNLDNHVYGFDAKSGEKVFDYFEYSDGGKSVKISGQFAAWPVVVGNQIIVATQDGKLFALGTQRSNPTIKLVDDLPAGVTVTSPLSAINDVISVNGSDDNLYQVNVVTGQTTSPVSLKKS